MSQDGHFNPRSVFEGRVTRSQALIRKHNVDELRAAASQQNNSDQSGDDISSQDQTGRALSLDKLVDLAT
jgi:hypothetical protein